MLLLKKRGWRTVFRGGSCVGDAATKLWTLRLHPAAVRITRPAPKKRRVKPSFVSTQFSTCTKKNKGETVLGWPFCLFLFTPSFLFATPKRADKPRARTNDANNGLKINSFLPNSSACMSVPLLPTRTRAIVPPDGTCS